MPLPPPHKRRRIIIVTSDDEGGGPVPAPLTSTAEAEPPPQLGRPFDRFGEHLDRLIPAEVGGEAFIDHLQGFVSSDSGSSDSDDPISRKARKMALRMHLEKVRVHESSLAPFLYAAKHGHFPKRTGPSQPRPHHPSQDDGNLWNARPPVSSQFLELEAAHGISQTSGSTGASDGSLSDSDFIDRASPIYTQEETAALQLHFPISSRRILKTSVPDVAVGPHHQVGRCACPCSHCASVRRPSSEGSVRNAD
jgi:hypothetical protein